MRDRRDDTKWRELAGLIKQIFAMTALAAVAEVPNRPYGADEIRAPRPSARQKLVIFTEHKDTLNYLHERITTLIGRREAVVTIHGGVSRRDRLAAQESFRRNPDVRILLATDAAGEGVNLQCAHLMVNYDLPWNPNRIEQRFGRIHRIGQTESCHLWNLVAEDTREGRVYRTLLDKLETARKALGGQVFDVLGQVEFEGSSLRDLLVEAIRSGERPAVRDRLDTAVDRALDRKRLKSLMRRHALVENAMDGGRLQAVRSEMKRADIWRLQPRFIESFFLDALKRLGGRAHQREPRRYEISHVPVAIRKRATRSKAGTPVAHRYRRVGFDKSLVTLGGESPTAFVCPGHPLFDAVTDITLERHGGLLERGAVLVDDRDHGTDPRVVFYLEHAVYDRRRGKRGRVLSNRVSYVELVANRPPGPVAPAPYLDLRPLSPTDPTASQILAREECSWIDGGLAGQAVAYTAEEIVPGHTADIRKTRNEAIDRTEQAVRDRLTKEITHCHRRAQELKLKAGEGNADARRAAREAEREANDLHGRLKRRIRKLARERKIESGPPMVRGAMVVAPKGLLDHMAGLRVGPVPPPDTQAIAARAREIVMDEERALGFAPIDREFEKVGYDIESRDPDTGKLRFIEVKGRVAGARTITVTRREIVFSLHEPDDYILAIVEFREDKSHRVRYLRRPFGREPDFDAASVNYKLPELLKRATGPC